MAIELRTIKLRRDTTANWALENPILNEGELGIDLDNKITKLGDGTTTWALLPVFVQEGVLDVDEGTGAISLNSSASLSLTSTTQMLLSSSTTLTLNSSDTMSLVSNSGSSDILLNGQKYIFGASEYDPTTYFQVLGNSIFVNEANDNSFTIQTDDAVDGVASLTLQKGDGAYYRFSTLFNGNFTLSSNSFTPFTIASGAPDSVLTLDASGQVIVGNGVDTSDKLQVFGSGYFEDSLLVLSSSSADIQAQHSGVGTARNILTNSNGSWSLQISSSTGQFGLTDITNSKNNVVVYPYTATSQDGFMNFFDYSTNLSTNRYFLKANRDGTNASKAQGIKLLDKSTGASENVELLVFDKDSSVTDTQYGGRTIRIGSQDGAGSYLARVSFLNSYNTVLGGSVRLTSTSSADSSQYTATLGETGNFTLESMADTDIDMVLKSSTQEYKLRLNTGDFVLRDETNTLDFLVYDNLTGITLNSDLIVASTYSITGETIVATESLQIPLNEPTVLTNGDIWIA